MPDRSRPANFFSVTPDFLAAWLKDRGQPSFRAEQILEWTYTKYAPVFSEMSDISKALREELATCFSLGLSRTIEERSSEDKRTIKYLLRLADGQRIECVLMRDASRTSLCLSCQTGCAMACSFCATGASGPGRNLTGAEIVEQAWRMGRPEHGFSHVVFMGMGEPLRNLDAVRFAIDALVDKRRFAIGARRITLSTCGIVSGIRELMAFPSPPHLAVSVNSPFEPERLELMPGTLKHPLDRALDAASDYVAKTGRHLTFEYVLLPGVNDTRRHSRALAKLARERRARINLIPYNPAPGSRFVTAEAEDTERFRAWLEQAKASVSTRFRRGREILAACGQLRGRTRRGEHGSAAPDA